MAHLIRLATQNDAAPMLSIYAPSIVDSATSFETEVPSLDEFKERISGTLEGLPWIVYTIDDVVAGYAYASPHRSRCAYGWSVETSVYVSHSMQGKGIGTQLYRALFELLKNQGVVNIFTGITQPNEKSVRLHESLGFTPIGIFKNVGFKQGKWWDVGWWQLQLQRLEEPQPLKAPVSSLEVRV